MIRLALKTQANKRTPQRYKIILANYGYALQGKVLELGCDIAYLRKHIDKYYGVDQGGKPDAKINLEEDRWKFKPNSFDTVICLDVLEHLNNFKEVLNNIVKTSKRHIIISLPNNYYFISRIFFLFGIEDSRQFGLRPTNQHKWFMSINQIDSFLKEYSRKNNLKIISKYAFEVLWDGKRRLRQIYRLFYFIRRPLQIMFPNLFCNNIIYVLKKGEVKS